MTEVDRDSLVGRGDEVAEIGDALGDPSSSGVVLVGQGGVGKTHLARYALRTAKASGFATATVLATRAASTIPLGALESIVGDGYDSGSVGVLRSTRARILELADGAPLILLVDDAHLLDDTSATLVLQLAGDDNVFVLATVRSGEEVPDPVTALWKDAGARRIDVEPLSRRGTEELLHSILGGPVAMGALNRLAEIGRGVPLALCELVDAARRSGALIQRDGIWCLVGELALSDRLVDLIRARLAGCADREREGLATVAMGDPLPLDVAAQVVGSDVLRSLEDQRLIEVRATDDVTLGHPLYGEVASRELGELRRRELLATLADAMESGHPSTTTDLRVAIWRLAAGVDADAGLLLRGAEAAYRASDHATTVRLATAAWERVEAPEAGHLRGLALGRMARTHEAESALADASAVLAADSADDDRMRVQIALARSENLFRGLNDAPAALDCVTAAEVTTSDDVWRDELVAHRAMLMLQLGNVDDALELTAPLLAADVPARPFVKAAYAAGIGLVYAGGCERAAALAQRALPVHERVWADDVFQTEPAVHHVTAIMALVESGQLTAAEGYAEVAVQVASEAGESYGLAYMSMLAGLVALRRGKPVTARHRCLDAVPLFRAAGYPSPLRWVLAGASMAAAVTGDVAAAREHLDMADGLADQTPVRLNEAMLHEARGWLNVATGNLVAAKASLLAGADDAVDRGELASAANLLHTVGRIGAAAEVADRLADLSGSIEGDLQRLRVDHLRALAAGDGSRLDAAAEGFAAAGANLFAAEAAAEAVRAHRRRGDQRSATRSARIAEEHAARCEGARTPAMTMTDTVEPLTDREREIALLAADGLSSKLIAERLVVSRRTVDNHLQRVFGKLGISSRSDLAEALGRAE